jgi:uncharacterized membrane protein YgcG
MGCSGGDSDVEVATGGTTEAPPVGPPVQCLTDSECEAKMETSACVTGICENGECGTRNVGLGTPCFEGDGDGTAGECQSLACDGNGSCGVVAALEGQPCTGGTICNPRQCSLGQCVDGKVLKCFDGNACTDDVCDPNIGCVFEFNSAPCNDGDPCTEDDACFEGFCSAGQLVCECDTNKDCAALDIDLCDGILICNPLQKCVNDPSQAVTCTPPEDMGQCENIACNPTSGECETSVSAGAACDDGDACTEGDYCATNGNCVQGNTYLCEICDNEIDDNGDEKVDCNDPLCTEDEACLPSGTDESGGSTTGGTGDSGGSTTGGTGDSGGSTGGGTGDSGGSSTG